MNDIVSAYLKGREEGYFNVRLGYEILYSNPQTRAFFGKGYKMGEKTREIERQHESESEKTSYEQHRKAYITIIGYRSVSENYIADSGMLKNEEDARAFEQGCKIALAYKDKDINTLDNNDADLYALLTGYNNAMEHNLNCSFIVKEENSRAFQQGYNVGQICKDIKRDAIKELSDVQLQLYKNRSKTK